MARILIADDAAPVRFVVKEILEQGGHQVVAEASSGQQALREFARQLPDVTLIDVEMPVMNGARAARAIRDLAPQAVLILMSGVEQTELRSHAEELDAFFITKPFLADELLQTVAEATS